VRDAIFFIEDDHGAPAQASSPRRIVPVHPISRYPLEPDIGNRFAVCCRLQRSNQQALSNRMPFLLAVIGLPFFSAASGKSSTRKFVSRCRMSYRAQDSAFEDSIRLFGAGTGESLLK